jgi:hypothetical protein
MPSDKQPTAIAVILLVVPVFILPFEVETLSPDRLGGNAEAGSYEQKASVGTDALGPRIFK